MSHNRPDPRLTLRDEFTLEDFSGSLNQAAPPDKVPATDFLRFSNARVCDDAKSFERRPGTVKIHTFTDRVLGVYGINDPEETKLLACLGGDIQLRSGGAWGSIFTPTKPALSPVQIAQHKGLTFIAGYEKPIVVRNGIALYPGLDAPTEAPTPVSMSSGSEILAESYAETNVDHLGELRQNATRTLIAQTFKATKTIDVAQVKLYLRKVGSPTGHVWVEIHSGTSGTSGTKNASASIVGEAAAELDISTLTNAFTAKTFVFSGVPPALVDGSTYFIVVYGDFTVSDSNYVLVGFDSSATGYAEGRYYEVSGSMAWLANDIADLVFEVIGPPGDLEFICKLGPEVTSVSHAIGDSASNVALAQSFTVDREVDVSRISLPLCRVGFPVGDMWAEIHSRTDTKVRVKANAGDTTIAVVSTTGMANGDEIAIVLQTGSSEPVYHWSTVSSFTADTVVIDDPIPALHYSLVNSKVFFQKVTSLTKDASADIVGLGSDDANMTLLNAAPHYIHFYFNASAPRLTTGTTYYIVLYLTFAISPSNYVKWYQVYGYEAMRASSISSAAAWSSIMANDFCYEIWGYSVADQKAAEYASSNLDTYGGLRETAAQTILAQSFVATFSGDITKVQLYLSKYGSPTGHIWAEIHSSQVGTAGSKNSSTNQVGQATDELDVSTLDAFPTFAVKDLEFNGTPPTLIQGTTYFIVVYGDYAASATAFVKVGMDKDDPETSGYLFDIDGSAVWTQRFGASLIYYLWRASGDIVGTFSYLVTFIRGGNYPCESNPSPVSVDVAVMAGESVSLTGIQVSPDTSVTARNVYRTESNMAVHKLAFQIPDNTTTTATDNTDDSALGGEASYGNSRPPEGSTIETWDSRLWVGGVPGYDEILFPSGLDTPEQFDITYFLMCREKEAGKITKIMEFSNELVAFKAASIWMVTRSGDSYIVDKIVNDVGLGAIGTAVVCGQGMLIFLSNFKKIEIFTPNGLAKGEVPVSAKVKAVLASINPAAMHKCVAGNYVDRGEYRLAVPTGVNTEPDTVIVFNYLRGTFGLDTYGHRPTSMNLTDYELGSRAFVQGASSGEIYRVDESALDDDGAGITMDVQTGWFTTPTKVKIFKTFLDYILEENMTLDFMAYRNFEDTASYQKSLAGNTPAGLSPELRDTVRAKLGMALQGKAFSFRFVNSEATKIKVSRIDCQIIVREKGMGVQAT